MSLGKHKRGRVWHVRGKVRGRLIRRSTGTADEQAAEAIRIKWEAEALERSVFGAKANATFAEAALMYMDAGGEQRFLKPLVLHLGKMKLADIRQSQVDGAARALYPGRTAATLVRQVYVPVTAIFNLAAENELCEPRRFKRPKVRHKPRPVPSDDWWAKVLPECSPHLSALLQFLADSGARISEACRVTWADVDVERRTILIERTKTGEPRLVKVSLPVWAALTALPRDDRPVFRYKGRGGVYGALRSACERAGVAYHSTHEIGRHSFATGLLRAGASLALTQMLGGWASGRLVTDTYGHLERRDGGELLEAIAAKRSPKLKKVK